MDTEVHGYILREVLTGLADEFDPAVTAALIEQTSYPDILPKEEIRSFKTPASRSKPLLDNLFYGFQWVGHAIRELSQWGYDHSVAAVEQAMDHLRAVLTECDRLGSDRGADRSQLVHELAFASHYIVDAGTPFHARDFREIFLEDVFTVGENEAGDPKVKTNVMRLLFNVSYFFIIHNKFEHDMRRQWKKEPGLYEAVIRSIMARLPAEDPYAAFAPDRFLKRYERDLTELKRFAESKYSVLYQLYMEPLANDQRFKNGRYIQEFMDREYRGQYQARIVEIATQLLEGIIPLLVRVYCYPKIKEHLL